MQVLARQFLPNDVRARLASGVKALKVSNTLAHEYRAARLDDDKLKRRPQHTPMISGGERSELIAGIREFNRRWNRRAA